MQTSNTAPAVTDEYKQLCREEVAGMVGDFIATASEQTGVNAGEKLNAEKLTDAIVSLFDLSPADLAVVGILVPHIAKVALRQELSTGKCAASMWTFGR